jgi:hypothetical protein
MTNSGDKSEEQLLANLAEAAMRAEAGLHPSLSDREATSRVTDAMTKPVVHKGSRREGNLIGPGDAEAIEADVATYEAALAARAALMEQAVADFIPIVERRLAISKTNKAHGRKLAAFVDEDSEERFARDFAQRVADQGASGGGEWWSSAKKFAEKLKQDYLANNGNSCGDCLRNGKLPAVDSIRKLVGQWQRKRWLRINMERKPRAAKSNKA